MLMVKYRYFWRLFLFILLARHTCPSIIQNIELLPGTSVCNLTFFFLSKRSNCGLYVKRRFNIWSCFVHKHYKKFCSLSESRKFDIMFKGFLKNMAVTMKVFWNCLDGLNYYFMCTFCSCFHIKPCIKTENWVDIAQFWLLYMYFGSTYFDIWFKLPFLAVTWCLLQYQKYSGLCLQ